MGGGKELGPDSCPAACVWVMADPNGPEVSPGEAWLPWGEDPRCSCSRPPLLMGELMDGSATIDEACMCDGAIQLPDTAA